MESKLNILPIKVHVTFLCLGDPALNRPGSGVGVHNQGTSMCRLK